MKLGFKTRNKHNAKNEIANHSFNGLRSNPSTKKPHADVQNRINQGAYSVSDNDVVDRKLTSAVRADTVIK